MRKTGTRSAIRANSSSGALPVHPQLCPGAGSEREITPQDRRAVTNRDLHQAHGPGTGMPQHHMVLGRTDVAHPVRVVAEHRHQIVVGDHQRQRDEPARATPGHLHRDQALRCQPRRGGEHLLPNHHACQAARAAAAVHPPVEPAQRTCGVVTPPGSHPPRTTPHSHTRTGNPDVACLIVSTMVPSLLLAGAGQPTPLVRQTPPPPSPSARAGRSPRRRHPVHAGRQPATTRPRLGSTLFQAANVPGSPSRSRGFAHPPSDERTGTSPGPNGSASGTYGPRPRGRAARILER